MEQEAATKLEHASIDPSILYGEVQPSAQRRQYSSGHLDANTISW